MSQGERDPFERFATRGPVVDPEERTPVSGLALGARMVGDRLESIDVVSSPVEAVTVEMVPAGRDAKGRVLFPDDRVRWRGGVWVVTGAGPVSALKGRPTLRLLRYRYSVDAREVERVDAQEGKAT